MGEREEGRRPVGTCHILELDLTRHSHFLQVNQNPGPVESWEQLGELASWPCFPSAFASSSGESGLRGWRERPAVGRGYSRGISA